MNTKDQMIREITEIARGFNEKEREALRTFIRALEDGKSPDEAQRAGDAVLTTEH